MDTPSAVWWRRPRRADAIALALLVAVPLVVFVVPTLAGHPPIAWDNLLQNYPLRVLTGEMLRGGHLPLLNPLADSGTPLLGGMNAGSFYPLTLLFVVPAPLAVWALTLVVVYAGASVGLFALLRWHGVSTWSAAVPALLYAFTGAMNGQMVHLGVVEGYALLPWYALVLSALARTMHRPGLSVRTAAPGVLGIAVLWALTTLSGEPRAIAEMELLGSVLIVVFALSRHGGAVPWRQRAGYVVANAVGIVGGTLIGLAQLLPGWAVIGQSQRTHLSYQFFGTGSLVVRWSILWLLPDVMGGNGMLHQPIYFANYNLPEVTGYVSLAAWGAALAFVVRRRRGGWRSAERPFVPYLVVGVIGALATWGNFTPAGRLFWQLPLFGSTRLQSRNVILLDLALLVLLGWWLDHLGDEPVARARRWLARAVPLLPALLAAAGSVVMLADGRALERGLGVGVAASSRGSLLTLTAIADLVVALGYVVVLARRGRSAAWRRALIAVVALDAGVFALFTTTGLASGHVPVMPRRAHAVARLGAEGRFALVDPTGGHGDLYDSLGLPNVNVFTGLPSVQGYGSLIDSLYGRVTDVHPLFSLDACQLARGTFRQLRLATVAVAADQLATPLTLGSGAPLRCVRPGTVHHAEFAFGQMLPVRSVTLASVAARTVSRGILTVQLLDARGRPFGPVHQLTGGASVIVDFASLHRDAAGFTVTAPEGARIDTAIVVTRGAHATSLRLETPFQEALAGPQWHLALTEGTVAYFRARSVRPPAWLARAPRGSRVLSATDTSWGETLVRVDATGPVILKRSMTWIPGWRASATSLTGTRAVTLHVVRSGLIQQVTLPAGRWEVRFTYHAPHLVAGLVGSALGVVAWIGGLLWWRRGRRVPGRVRA